MYDSTVGRWLTQDPKLFEAGDTNLYRMVGNSPNNATDPSGLEAAYAFSHAADQAKRRRDRTKDMTPRSSTSNQPCDTAGSFFGQIFSFSRESQLEGLTDMTFTTQYRGTTIPGAAAREHAIVPKLKPGQVVGVDGLGPCIGVIVTLPDGSIFLAHFGTEDSPRQTLLEYQFPKGSKAVIFGGNSSWPSLSTLDSTRAGLSAAGVEVIGHSDTSSGYIDSDGKYYHREPPTAAKSRD